MLRISRDKAIKAFGSREAVPDWVWALAEECDRTSQIKASARLRVSPSMVSQALSNKYNNGKTGDLEKRVRGEFMAASCVCPVLGDISTRQCSDEQKRPFAATNSLRIAVFNACRNGCGNFRGGDK